jgi:hypothetical protein
VESIGHLIVLIVTILKKIMKIDLPQVIDQVGGRNKITPRYYQSHNWKKLVGKTLKCNVFPTFLGKFL